MRLQHIAQVCLSVVLAVTGALPTRASAATGKGGDSGVPDGGRGGNAAAADANGGHAAAWEGRSAASGAAHIVADQDLAHDAVRRGFVEPLDRVLPTVSRLAPGRVLNVELERKDDGIWLYRFRIITDDFHYTNLTVNASTSAVITAKGR